MKKAKKKVKVKAKVKAKAKASPKRPAVKDLSAKKASAVKGGLLPAVNVARAEKWAPSSNAGLLLPAVQKIADGSV